MWHIFFDRFPYRERRASAPRLNILLFAAYDDTVDHSTGHVAGREGPPPLNLFRRPSPQTIQINANLYTLFFTEHQKHALWEPSSGRRDHYVQENLKGAVRSKFGTIRNTLGVIH
jgi:hypothetical protein